MKAAEDMRDSVQAQSEFNQPETVARDFREYIEQLEAEWRTCPRQRGSRSA